MPYDHKLHISWSDMQTILNNMWKAWYHGYGPGWSSSLDNVSCKVYMSHESKLIIHLKCKIVNYS